MDIPNAESATITEIINKTKTTIEFFYLIFSAQPGELCVK